jgi:hypothetical protein
MDIFLWDVNFIKEILFHETKIGLERFRLHWVVFIQVEGNNILEGKSFFAMHSLEFFIDSDGSRAGGKTENTLLAFLFFFKNSITNNFGGIDACLN